MHCITCRVFAGTTRSLLQRALFLLAPYCSPRVASFCTCSTYVYIYIYTTIYTTRITRSLRCISLYRALFLLSVMCTSSRRLCTVFLSHKFCRSFRIPYATAIYEYIIALLRVQYSLIMVVLRVIISLYRVLLICMISPLWYNHVYIISVYRVLLNCISTPLWCHLGAIFALYRLRLSA